MGYVYSGYFNWGFLYDEFSDKVKLAPVYDCGSCLFPQVNNEMIDMILNDKNELNYRIYEMPTSAITYNEKRINYFKFISSHINKDCDEALKGIVPKIDMVKINKLIDEIECISDKEKTFYKEILKQRKEKILDFSLNNI